MAIKDETDLLQSVTEAIDVMAHIEESFIQDLPRIVELVKELDEKVLAAYEGKQLRTFLLMAAFGLIAGRDADDKDGVQFANFTFLVAAQRGYAAKMEAAAELLN